MSEKYLDSFFDDSFSYSGVQPLEEIASAIEKPVDEILKLNANENPYGFPKELLTFITKEKTISQYPDPKQKKVREKIADYLNLATEKILVGNGSDEVIDLLCRFLPRDSSVLLFPPTFAYYDYLVRLNRLQVIQVPRKENFSIDLKLAEKYKNQKPSVIFLCSPNNPTGNLASLEEVEFFLSWDSLVVIDEAYFEFSQKSYLDLLAKNQNLIILRTFSKFFGLAGIRLGYSIANPSLQQKLLNLKYPYNIHQLALGFIESCFSNLAIFETQRKEMEQTKNLLIQDLEAIPQLKPYPSSANFVLCKVKNYSAKKLTEELYQKGVLIRYFETSLLKNYIRISIGTPEQMKKFLKILFSILK